MQVAESGAALEEPHDRQATQSIGADGCSSTSAASQGGRQQAAARVRSIAARLLESRGAERRRTLFALRQTFQDEPQLGQAFLECDGLECLLGAAREADQVQQNYILRAIGQLIAQPRAASRLARHEETLQWLYQLLSSQHRLVARAALRLLLLCVGQSGAGPLCAAIKRADQVKGQSHWWPLIELFKQDSANTQDVGLLVDSMTLINRTLDQIPQDEEDTYFEFIEALEQAGMESIIKKYSNLDAQLREQFRLYERKLATDEVEDEDEAAEAEAEAEAEAGNMGDRAREKQQQPSRVTFSANIEKRAPRENYDHDGEQEDDHNSNHEEHTNNNEAPTKRHGTPVSYRQFTSEKVKAPRQAPPLAQMSSDESDEHQTTTTTTADDDDESNNYESANDESNEPPPGTRPQQHRQEVALAHDNGSRASSQILVNNRLVQTVEAAVPIADHQRARNGASQRQQHRHQLQLRSQPAAATVRRPAGELSADNNNLARGRQQRASISSCSSSDSYASYGSGYASGSGNSTDHEHRQRCKAPAASSAPASPESANKGSKATASSASLPAPASSSSPTSSTSNLGALATAIINLNIDSSKQQQPRRNHSKASNALGNEDADADADADADNVPDEDVEEADEEEEDEDSQLKQHLCELEQLTDELAKRGDVYPSRLAADRQHYSPLGKSADSSKSSSIISSSSNISSLSSGINATAAPGSLGNGCAGEDAAFAATAAAAAAAAATSASDSRSTSATPTSSVQPAAAKVVSYLTRQQQQQARDNLNESSQTAAAATPSLLSNNSIKIMSGGGAGSNSTSAVPSARGHLRATCAPPANKQQAQAPQESYYHNLFQWEQLVSKGVTRPLLINDLDFTDLRDEDDCDLLTSQAGPASKRPVGQTPGEPLTISIPVMGQPSQKGGHDSLDSGTSGSGGTGGCTPASAPPPLPPPPISPWFNTVAGSRPQSQFMSSPSPVAFASECSYASGARDHSPSASSTYSGYGRNSVCVSSAQPNPGQQSNQFGALPLAGGAGLRSASSMSSLLFGNGGAKYATAGSRKKTMKLFWKEVREERSLLARLTRKKTIWDELKPVQVDTSKLEYLFESKAKDLASLSKSRNGLDGSSARKLKITVLDAKRSNAINIGMTKLPPMRTIKSAILKMDSSIMNREGIEKILTTMMPTEEEKSRIIEAQLANPDTPLGTAEQFLLNLASISALEARLKLWAFQLNYAQIEKEVAEPLMDLKQAIEEIERSETFRNILATLLSIGNFLNSTNAKGFQIDYLEKVPEVKDTVNKHSLLHHLCLFIQEKFDPELAGDLYSEFGAVNRASKVDYAEVAKSLKRMQQDCKASWDHLKIVAKHDGLANLMNTCGNSSSSSSCEGSVGAGQHHHQPAWAAGKLNNLSKLSMITTVIGGESAGGGGGPSSSSAPANSHATALGPGGDSQQQQQQPTPTTTTTTKQLKMKVSDFLTDCAERIMVLMVVHRRVINRFQKLLVYLGCPLQQIKQTQPQQILKIINEFALEYRTKRERVREMLMRKQQCLQQSPPGRSAYHERHANRMRWTGSTQCISSMAADGELLLTDQQRRRQSVEPAIGRPGDGAADQGDHSASSAHAANAAASPCRQASKDELIRQQDEQLRQRDEQLRRLLGAGKSLDEACHDLYQMSHWSSTMARVSRPAPPWSHRS